jgi:exodeoxyribonuclease VII large subunit
MTESSRSGRRSSGAPVDAATAGSANGGAGDSAHGTTGQATGGGAAAPATPEPAGRGHPLDAGSRTVRDVGEVATLIGQRLQRAFPEPLWVRGEVLDCTFGDDGTVRFELAEEGVDDDRVRPRQLHVHLPPEQLARVRAVLGVYAIDPRDLLFDGQSVLVSGTLTYSDSDQVELRMDGLDHHSTTGMLTAAKAEARARLQAAGLYGRQRALPLPVAPTTVAIIGANRGSAIDDALNELTRCEFSIATHTFAVRMEGRGAVGELADAIGRAAKGSQLVLLVRGEDRLTSRAPFESERVAAAIAASPVPVLTGVDAQGEQTLADEIAARSLGTPARAASETVQRLRAALRQLHGVDQRTLEEARAALDRIAAEYAQTARSVRWAIRQAETRARRTARNRQFRRVALGGLLLAGLVTVAALASPLQRALLVALLIMTGVLVAQQLTRRGDGERMERQEAAVQRQRTFEQAIARLEEIAARLAKVSSPEEVVDLAREASELRRWCEGSLGWAEQSLATTAAPPAVARKQPEQAPPPDRPPRQRTPRPGAAKPPGGKPGGQPGAERPAPD